MNVNHTLDWCSTLMDDVGIHDLISSLRAIPISTLVLGELRKTEKELVAAIRSNKRLVASVERPHASRILRLLLWDNRQEDFWKIDSGRILAAVYFGLNERLFPSEAKDAAVFSLFRLFVLLLAERVRQDPKLERLARRACECAEVSPEQGEITKRLQVAYSDYDAGNISPLYLLTIYQAAIDNGDILVWPNDVEFVMDGIVPLVEMRLLLPSNHLAFLPTVTVSSSKWDGFLDKAWLALRWILVGPLTICVALIARYIYLVINRRDMLEPPEEEFVLVQLSRNFLAGCLFGAALVYIAGFVAPSHKRGVSITSAAVFLLLVGFVLFPSVAGRNVMAVTEGVGMILGICIVTAALIREDIGFD